ncbi:MAG: T9SS type A sorting domain-containing protein, partial [Prevotellaceae bacterium]|nr:T9SS type A sorting domain-containing protein [Prevotellaceae bacterium]
EHLGSIRVVDNNPAINKSGLEFKWCLWEQKKGDSWVPVGGNQLYYTAGQSVHEKFSPMDSMRVTLRTVSGSYLKTCPDVGHSPDEGSVPDVHPAEVEVYPNPVAAGGIIKLKLNNPADGTSDKEVVKSLYTTFYIFNTQGQLVLSGSASILSDGLAMPEIPGIYHLILEGKAGKKAIEVAVGQR